LAKGALIGHWVDEVAIRVVAAEADVNVHASQTLPHHLPASPASVGSPIPNDHSVVAAGRAGGGIGASDAVREGIRAEVARHTQVVPHGAAIASPRRTSITVNVDSRAG
jgi:hypothetical protein